MAGGCPAPLAPSAAGCMLYRHRLPHSIPYRRGGPPPVPRLLGSLQRRRRRTPGRHPCSPPPRPRSPCVPPRPSVRMLTPEDPVVTETEVENMKRKSSDIGWEWGRRCDTNDGLFNMLSDSSHE